MNWIGMMYAQSAGDVHVILSGAVSLESSASAIAASRMSISVPNPRLIATANQSLGSEIPDQHIEVNHG